MIVYDLVAFQPGIAARRSSALIERATIGPGVRRAAQICSASRTATRRDLVARFPRARAEGIESFRSLRTSGSACPLAPDDLEEVRRRYGLDAEFVLCTGTLEPRKNLVRVLEAHAGLARSVQLALVGPRGWEFEPILEAAGRRDDVRVLGQISDEDLRALYQACTVFCYPSLYEGFGLPLLEAMAAGAACVTSSVSSLPEVGGDAVRLRRPAGRRSRSGQRSTTCSPPRRSGPSSGARAKRASRRILVGPDGCRRARGAYAARDG